jgi:hypothetical protein
MVKKTKLTAEYDGNVFTRTTDRNYTNVVIGFIKGDREAPWVALSWASSPKLANKAARQFGKYEILIIDVKQPEALVA